MAQSVTIATATPGEYGPTYGEGTAYTCYVKQKVVKIINHTGEEDTSHCQIYLDGAADVKNTDRVTYDGNSPPIKRVEPRTDEAGNQYATLVFT